VSNQKPLAGELIDYGSSLSQGLVGCWLMNEGGGNKIYDLSGYDNNGTISGLTWQPSKFGSALNGDGLGNHIDCGETNQIEGILSLSASFWAKVPNSTVTATEFLVAKYGDANDRTFAFYTNTSENIYFTAFNSNNDAALCWYTDAFLNKANVWRHIVGVYDGINTRIWADGVVGTSAALTGVTDSSTSNLIVFAEKISGSNDFIGSIDNIMIWNRALTTSEIKQLYAEPFCMFKKRKRIIAPEVAVGLGMPLVMHHRKMMEAA
jgi:hypothetical protein